MKTKTKTIILSLILMVTAVFCPTAFAQEKNAGSKPRLTVLNIDMKGLTMDQVQMGNLVRIELDKLQQFEVMDKYDVANVVEKNKLTINNCYGKICLVEIGKIINSEKMFTGNVELLGEKIVVSLRLIDVKTETIEKSQVTEFLNLQKEIQSMISVTINQMFSLPNQEATVASLTIKNSFDNAVNNPSKNRLRLDGPRMGATVFTGTTAKILQSPTTQGGYGAVPVMFQFGYQFEKQYLNSANIQALFEFIPMVTGLDQGLFIPSFTFMHGIRSNKSGWELAFGPSFSLVKKAKGYYDSNNDWQLSEEWNQRNPYNKPEPVFITRLDSRGRTYLNSSFVLAAGKSFKSGKLNIPVNIYVIPGKDGIRCGTSFGFNGKNK